MPASQLSSKIDLFMGGDWLGYNGYTVVTKTAKEFLHTSGRRKIKGDMNIELAVDVMGLAKTIRSGGVVLRRRRVPLTG
jgi:uncharacterized LabA/DUF88 family protein